MNLFYFRYCQNMEAARNAVTEVRNKIKIIEKWLIFEKKNIKFKKNFKIWYKSCFRVKFYNNEPNQNKSSCKSKLAKSLF